ncbi:hypothetical protein CBR_g12187 [Chara braunii]|uniref:Uncharacterized protein n=1 Tax=Chara braunii TaxID=69332 RepID=A0A388KRC5_CHABU|nr:hypothetical protein CBR_g12187 [Chara braunii]|eukprot:GBG72614.1 hypothetical protein CBR_g12187 [Chara braunii]
MAPSWNVAASQPLFVYEDEVMVPAVVREEDAECASHHSIFDEADEHAACTFGMVGLPNYQFHHPISAALLRSDEHQGTMGVDAMEEMAPMSTDSLLDKSVAIPDSLMSDVLETTIEDAAPNTLGSGLAFDSPLASIRSSGVFLDIVTSSVMDESAAFFLSTALSSICHQDSDIAPTTCPSPTGDREPFPAFVTKSRTESTPSVSDRFKRLSMDNKENIDPLKFSELWAREVEQRLNGVTSSPCTVSSDGWAESPRTRSPLPAGHPRSPLQDITSFFLPTRTNEGDACRDNLRDDRDDGSHDDDKKATFNTTTFKTKHTDSPAAKSAAASYKVSGDECSILIDCLRRCSAAGGVASSFPTSHAQLPNLVQRSQNGKRVASSATSKKQKHADRTKARRPSTVSARMLR